MTTQFKIAEPGGASTRAGSDLFTQCDPFHAPCPQLWKGSTRIFVHVESYSPAPSSTCQNPFQELGKFMVILMRHTHSRTFRLNIQALKFDFLSSSLDSPFTSCVTLNKQTVPSLFNFFSFN